MGYMYQGYFEHFFHSKLNSGSNIEDIAPIFWKYGGKREMYRTSPLKIQRFEFLPAFLEEMLLFKETLPMGIH